MALYVSDDDKFNKKQLSLLWIISQILEKLCYPVDCIKIETAKAPDRGEDIKDVRHVGITSNGSRKAMVVTRFDIDMTECCYCNLCTYPCPEECIFMTGGPNSKRHPIDYEFSEPDRSDLIYRFAKPGTKEGMEKILSETNKAKA